MRSFLIFVALIAALLPMTSRAQSISWGTILTCDNMALQVKIDPFERRRVQIAIMGNIVYYLTGYPQNQNPLFSYGGPNRLYPLTAFAEAWVPNGIFSRGDFHGVVIQAGSRGPQAPGLRFFLSDSGGASLNIVNTSGQSLTNWYFHSCSWNF